MAKELDDGEFWLPPEFLTDDDILMDCKSSDNKVGDVVPFDFSCSGLTSPEIESDEDDCLAGWTRRIAQNKLDDMIWKSVTGFGHDNQKVSVMASSPQSTLCSYLGGCGCGCKSPNCPSRVSSPTLLPMPTSSTPVLNRMDAAQDLLLAAAGEVARLRMFEEVSGYYQNGAPPRPGFYPNDSLFYTQLQAAKFHQQMLKQQQALTVCGQMKPSSVYQQTHLIAAQQMEEGNNMMNANRLLGLSPSAWPTLQQSQQQPASSGMRAIFVGNHVTKPERAGTGVFLPRQVTTQAEFRRKPSSILLPDQVFKALNLEENINIQTQFPSRHRGNFAPVDYGLKQPYHGGERSSHIRRLQQQQPLNHEIQLPHEWTY